MQLVNYLAAARAALGALPTQTTVIFERFFDEAGGMQLVIHSPFGSRVNRAWGLSLRKRFCRSFNFELQAAATEDTIILSLTTAHSFELAEVARYLHSNSVRPLLVQALCAAPMFPVRWRWSASIALALPRFRGGKKLPAPLARMAAEDLLTAVFPDQVACAENLPGELEIPDHPLVRQTIRDCLEEAMDINGFERLLRGLESGAISVIARDLTEPSPLALEVLSARPYAFLDDAPLEERRTQAVMSRRWLDPQSAADIGKLDPDAIRRVREEAWPDATNADELHDALLWLSFLTDAEAERGCGWSALLAGLAAQQRVTQLHCGAARLWVTAERLPLLRGTVSGRTRHSRGRDSRGPRADLHRRRRAGRGDSRPPGRPRTDERAGARGSLWVLPWHASMRRWRCCRPKASPCAAHSPPRRLQANEWCERRLLARIHRYTVKRLRAEIEPIDARDFLRFLFEWQRVTPALRMEGPDAVGAILAQLEGFEAPASAWETEVLPNRISEYEPAWLDEQCLAGRFVWTRLAARRSDPERGAAPVRATPIVLLARRNLRLWSAFAGAADPRQLSAGAQRAAEHLTRHGASFFDEIASGTGLLPSQAEEALAELVALGLVNSDSFAGLRALLVPADRRRSAMAGRRRRRLALYGMDAAGRWSRTGSPQDPPSPLAPTIRAAPRRKPSSTSCARCCAAGESCSGGCWRARRTGCRRGATCSCAAGGSRRAARSAAGASSPASPASSTRLRRRSRLLREARRKPREGHYVSLSGADPLNLVGILTPGARLPSLSGNRLLYRDGVPVALLAGGEVSFLETLAPQEQWQAQNLLLRRHVPAALADLA